MNDCIANPPHRQRRFPRCRLHGVALVDRLPRACPFLAENTLDAIHAIERSAYAGLNDAETQTAGLDDLERAETCFACFRELSAHPRIQALKAQHGSSPPSRLELGHNGTSANRSSPPAARVSFNPITKSA